MVRILTIYFNRRYIMKIILFLLSISLGSFVSSVIAQESEPLEYTEDGEAVYTITNNTFDIIYFRLKIEGEEKLQPWDLMSVAVRAGEPEPGLFALKKKGDCVKVKESDFDILEIVKTEATKTFRLFAMESGTRIAPFCSYKKREDYGYKTFSRISNTKYQLEYDFMSCPPGNLIINSASYDLRPPHAFQVSVEPNQTHVNKKIKHELAIQDYQNYQTIETYYHNKTCFNLLWDEMDCGNEHAIIACDGDSDSPTIIKGGCDLLVDKNTGERLIPRPPKNPIHISHCKDLRDQISKG